ncbi:hypothetical protein L2E82_31651 [Cichorium intybus]|uniref:Uncharacterized protein n=1 Tax=Cichorium intybus TaxID=13427 RepID=A0ACB9BFB5_CICIN|nr:hypothetical protein L2E82_31651 [Cichorium intybus]
MVGTTHLFFHAKHSPTLLFTTPLLNNGHSGVQLLHPTLAIVTLLLDNGADVCRKNFRRLFAIGTVCAYLFKIVALFGDITIM